MPQFRKVVVPPGTYQTPQGHAVITPERIKGWVERFQRMKADRIKIPVPWGHQKTADPIDDPEAEAEYQRNRYNASFVDDLEIGPAGELVMAAEIPPGFRLSPSGDLEDPAGHTKIAEVSAAVCDWTDGKGRLWPDSIRHIALTTLPVAHGVGGFEPKELRLSLATQVSTNFTMGGSMPKMRETEEGYTAEKPGTEEPPVEKPEDMEGGKGEQKEEPIVRFNPEERHGLDGATRHQKLGECCSILKEGGVHLPHDSYGTSDEFVDHLHPALHALRGRAMHDKEEEPDAANTERDIEEEEEHNKRNPAHEEPIKEEAPMPSMMMSLAQKYPDDPEVQKMAAQHIEQDKAKRIKRIEILRDKRGMPPPLAAKLLKEASAFTLSLDPKTIQKSNLLDEQLAFAEDLLPAQSPLLSLHSAKEVPLPEHARAVEAEKAVKESADALTTWNDRNKNLRSA